MQTRIPPVPGRPPKRIQIERPHLAEEVEQFLKQFEWLDDEREDVRTTKEFAERVSLQVAWLGVRKDEFVSGKHSLGEQFALAYALWLSRDRPKLRQAVTRGAASKHRRTGGPQPFLLRLMNYPIGDEKEVRRKRSHQLSRDAKAIGYLATNGFSPAEVCRALGPGGDGSLDRWSKGGSTKPRRTSARKTIPKKKGKGIKNKLIPVIVRLDFGGGEAGAPESMSWKIDSAKLALLTLRLLSEAFSGSPHVTKLGSDD